MASTRNALNEIASNLDESMGIRTTDSRPHLSPVASLKDVGRRPLRTFGQVDIDLVQPDPKQPRSEFSAEAITRLAHSIREQGQLHPIRIRWDNTNEKWLIISGERRWRATKEAGLPTIDCYFQEGNISKSDILGQQLVENLLREDLRPIEEAKAFSALMELQGWNGKQVARALHVPESKVSRSLALLDLTPEMQAQVEAGRVAARTAYEITKLPQGTARQGLAESAAHGKLSHKQAAAAVRQRQGKATPKSRNTKQVFFADDGWRVTVSANKKGTYHEMEIALSQALEEVRHYINQGRTIL